MWDSLAGWRPPRFLTPVLSPGGEGHWRNAGAGLCPEAASGAPSGCRSAEPGLHEVLAGSGGGGGHASEGRQGPGPAKPEVPPNPDPCAHRSTAWQLSPKPASDPHLSPCHGPILGPAASPWASPCPCGSPGPSLCTRRCPASTCPGPGLEKDRTLAPEQREEPEQCQGTVGAAPKSVYRIRACVPVSLASLSQTLVPVAVPVCLLSRPLSVSAHFRVLPIFPRSLFPNLSSLSTPDRFSLSNLPRGVSSLSPFISASLLPSSLGYSTSPDQSEPPPGSFP